MQAATVITPSVRWLETASHMVKLETGLILEGSRKGNKAKPAVKIAPIIARLVPVKLRPAFDFDAPTMRTKAPIIATIGASILTG